MSPKSPGGILASLLLAAVGLALVTLGFEMVLRLVPKTAIAYRWEHGFGLRLLPNQRREFVRTPENGGQAIPWSTNSRGFRGEELREDPAVRILVYGDSNIQAQFSELEQTFCSRLQSLLRDAGDVEVVNAGTVGAGPDQNLVRMRRELPELRPDIVVFLVFADNDLGDVIRNRLFVVDPNGRLRRSSFDPQTDKALQVYAESRRGSLLWQRIRRLRWPSGEGTRRQRVERILERLAAELTDYEQGSERPFAQFDDSPDLDVSLYPRSAAARTKLRLLEAVVVEADSVARAAGVELLLLIEPSPIHVTTRQFVDPELLGRISSEYVPRSVTDAIAEIATRNHIGALDLFDPFRAHGADGLYFVQPDDHWNDAGQLLAARLVAERLRPSVERIASTAAAREPE